MKSLLINNKTQNPLDFISENQLKLFGKNIFIDNDIFQEIWDYCQKNNGTVKLSDDGKIKSTFPHGLFCFSFKEKDSNNLSVIEIANIGFGRGTKQLKLISISMDNLKYMHNPIPITKKVFITKNVTLAQKEPSMEL